jgi:hypothetical protein
MRENFERIFCAKTEDMLCLLHEDMTRLTMGLACNGKMFTYYPGTIPVMLVAHVDTVHSGPPTEVIIDNKTQIAWSPSGLGADDRAGVWAIMEILRAGYRPHVLFTDGEERGLIGAKEAAKAFEPSGVHCLIEMDRKGHKDSVFYSNDNRKFIGWVDSFGFKEESGSCSDISELMPEWNLSGVNLSIGYYRQHSDAEHLRLDEARITIGKVMKMLRKPPKGRVSYVKKEYAWQQNVPSKHTRWRQGKDGLWEPYEYTYTPGDYNGSLLPEHYREKKTGKPNTTSGMTDSSFLAADWRCDMCRHWYSNKTQQEPANGICEDCVKTAIEKAGGEGVNCEYCDETCGKAVCPDCLEMFHILQADFATATIPLADDTIPS